MKLRLHHIEICTEQPERVLAVLRDQFRFRVVGQRTTTLCDQIVVQMGKSKFIITSRKRYLDVSKAQETGNEAWTIFCCGQETTRSGSVHVDSAFNIALQVENLSECLHRLAKINCRTIRKPAVVSSEEGNVIYAIVQSCCGNIVHTLIQNLE